MTQTALDQNCLIIGSSKGIGLYTGEALQKKGFNVFFTGHYQKTSVDNARINNAKKNEIYYCDVKSRESLLSIDQDLKSKKIKLDVLVYNPVAQFSVKSTFTSNWKEDFEGQIKTSCEGFLNSVQCLHESLSNNGKIFITLTSALLVDDGSNMGGYLSGKGALFGLIHAWNKEISKQGRSLIILSPKSTNTDLLLKSSGSNPRRIELMRSLLDKSNVASPEQMGIQMSKVIFNTVHNTNDIKKDPRHYVLDSKHIYEIEVHLKEVFSDESI